MTTRYTFYKRLCRSKFSIRWQVFPNRGCTAEKVAIRSHGMKFMQWFNLVVVTSKLSELPILHGYEVCTFNSCSTEYDFIQQS